MTYNLSQAINTLETNRLTEIPGIYMKTSGVVTSFLSAQTSVENTDQKAQSDSQDDFIPIQSFFSWT